MVSLSVLVHEAGPPATRHLKLGREKRTAVLAGISCKRKANFLLLIRKSKVHTERPVLLFEFRFSHSSAIHETENLLRSKSLFSHVRVLL